MLLLTLLLAPLLSSCSAATAEAPRCTAVERLGLVAQSVPSASYVPCVAALPTGWNSENFTVERGATSFQLVSDRAQGRAVHVALRRSCDVSAAAPFPARTPGGRSYLALDSVRPRFTGTMIDVFPGGCVTYRFDFVRGPHIELMAQLQSAVTFVSRVQLRQELRRRLGVELGS